MTEKRIKCKDCGHKVFRITKDLEKKPPIVSINCQKCKRLIVRFEVRENTSMELSKVLPEEK